MTLDDALELITELADALDAALAELAAIEEMDMPVSDEATKVLRQGVALAATMARLPEEMKVRARALYREEFGRASAPSVALVRVPVSAEVRQQIEQTFELLRRRAIVESELSDVLRGVPIRDAMVG